MPGDSGVTVVTNARAFYTTRAAAGASGARHSLRPLFRGRDIRRQENSRETRGEIAAVCPGPSLPATNAKRLRKGALATKIPWGVDSDQV
jgi:hypothetical protein